METMTAYCGLRCDTCTIHLVTLEKSKTRQQSVRKSIAEECSRIYGMNMKPEDITDCDGCRANTGRIFSGCLNCEIRKCAGKRNIDSCAFCTEYPCDTLVMHFSLNPEAKNRLEEIRQREKIN